MPTVETIEIPIATEEDCAACAERLQEGLRTHRGIDAIVPAESGAALVVRYDPDLCSLACVSAEANRLQLDLAGRFGHGLLRVTGMDCYDCAQTIERAVCRLPGVSHATVNFPAARMRIEYEPSAIDLESISARVASLGYGIHTVGAAAAAPVAPWWKRRDVATAAAAVLLLAAVALDLATELTFLERLLYAAAVVVGGTPLARFGLAALRTTHRPDINVLMTVAAIGAMAIGAWLEAALVVVLFSVGQALEGRAVDRARRELEGLVSLAPEVARVRRRGATVEEVEVSVSELQLGDLVVVRPGERVPADGLVVEGGSAVDQAPITGESTPADKAAGDTVFAGTLNGQGLLVVEVGAAPGDSTLDRIGRLVAEAQARKSPSERWVDAFARVYTPIVIGAAVLVAAVPPLFGVSFETSFYSALALLIIACPCALVISTPVSIVSALGRASAAGVLVKGGAYLERAASIRSIAFDKTGTLTQGQPLVVSVEAFVGEPDQVLRLAASLEQGSEHPLAAAIVTAANERSLHLAPVVDFQALTGLGARGRIDGGETRIGNARLFETELAADEWAAAVLERLRLGGQTAVLVAVEGLIVGAIGLADRPRPEAADAIADLKTLDIHRIALLTGDNPTTASVIARKLGITEVRADLLPGQKTAAIEELGPQVAMVGDGVNDAPALAAADLGIAMGSAGSATAIEVADVALMGDDPRKVAGLVGLARWTKAVVRQNIAFSLGTKAIAVGVLAAGALPLWAAVGSDVGASLIVVANGLRLLRGTPAGRLRGLPLLYALPRKASR